MSAITDTMKKAFEEGQISFIETIKMSLYKEDPNIFEKIDFEDDSIYLDPLFFRYFTAEQKELPVEQIYYSQLKDPQVETTVPPFKADSNGLVYVNKQGYYRTQNAHSLHINDLTKLKDESTVFSPLVKVGNTDIELCAYNVHSLESFYQEWSDWKNTKIINKENTAFGKLKALIEKALEIIKDADETYYQHLIKSTQKIIIFENKDIPGFVTRRAHGAIYLSLCESSTLAEMIDEIVHQCGHNIFNAIICKKSDYIKIDPTTPLPTVIQNDNITNTDIEGAYHGVFTVNTGVQVLFNVLQKATLSEANRIELIGRLGVKKTRHKSWTPFADLDEVLTVKGNKILLELENIAGEIIQSNPDIFGLDFSNQPYTYSHEKFLEVNKM